MATSILTATVSTVKVGGLEFEGLMLEDGTFLIALQQTANIFSVLPNSAQIWLERLLGKGFQFYKVKTNRPKQEGKQNRAENAISLIQFEQVIRKLDRQGNQQAQNLVDAMLGLSLTQLFSDAFHVKFESEDRQAWLTARIKGKVARRGLTDAIKDWYIRNPNGTSRPQHVMYAVTTNRIYQALWGLDAMCLESILRCGRNKARDFMDSDSIKLLDRAESNVCDYIDDDNIKPVDAVSLANIRKSKKPPFKI